MKKKLALIADEVARKYPITNNWERIRDYCDIESCGELNCFALDMLVDMVETRFEKARKASV